MNKLDKQKNTAAPPNFTEAADKKTTSKMAHLKKMPGYDAQVASMSPSTGVKDSWMAMSGTSGAAGMGGYRDIKAGSYYEDAVNELSSGADPILQGDKETGNFRPKDPINQAEAMKVFCKANGIKPVPADPSRWYDAWMGAKPEAKVNNDPSHVMTRAEMAFMAMKIAGKPEVDAVAQPFTDIDKSHRYYGSVMAAALEGVFQGDSNSPTVRPDDTIIRADVAVVVQRMKNGATNSLRILSKEEADDVANSALHDAGLLLDKEGGATGTFVNDFALSSEYRSSEGLSLWADKWDNLEGFRAKITADLAASAWLNEPKLFEMIVEKRSQDAQKDTNQQIADGSAHPNLKKHFKSPIHQLYGKVVEHLTDGKISAEQAMALNPTGGLVGKGAEQLITPSNLKDLSLVYEQGNESTVRAMLTRHGVVHDALGFLYTFAGVGPGYSKNDPDNSLSGQGHGIVWSGLHGLDKEMAGLIDQVVAES